MFETVVEAVVSLIRKSVDKAASPSVGIVDSQIAKTNALVGFHADRSKGLDVISLAKEQHKTIEKVFADGDFV